MRSRILSTLAAVAAGVALTAGTAGIVGSALSGGSNSSPTTTHEAGKIMAHGPVTPPAGNGKPGI
jgi:phage-related minor tail protein